MNIDFVNNAGERAKRISELSRLIEQETRAIKIQTSINCAVPTDLVELLKGHKKEIEDLMVIEERCRELISEQKKRLDNGEDIHYPANANTSKPMQNEGLKLTWNYENAVLYDIFAQLSLMETAKNQPVIGNSIEHIAQWINENFEGFPSVDTINRQILSIRGDENNRPKRNQITIKVERP